MNAFIIIAIGKEYFNLALNCCLSIKANEDIPVILVHDELAIKGKEYYLEFFDEKILTSHDKPAQYHSMVAKLELLNLVSKLPYEKFILLDADVLFLPDKKPSELFNQQGSFVPYIHDLFDYTTQSSQRETANFWCNPNEAKVHFKLEHNLPQINASFIYFTKEAKPIFDYALKVWEDDKFNYFKFRGFKTEELCFNVAMAKLGVEPRQVPYRPIFFQVFTELQEESYIQHNYPAMGLAGDIKHNPALISFYNRTAKYWRDFFGLKEQYVFEPQGKKAKSVKYIEIPHTRRTLYRAGELPNSDGGIFNPDGIIYQRKHYEIFRKESSYDLYKHRYSKTSAIPHMNIGELTVHGWDGLRLEDFRLFSHYLLFCNHTVAYPERGVKLQGQQYDKITCGVSIIDVKKKTLTKVCIPSVGKGNLEKNWVYWFNRDAYLLYSLKPFILYKTTNWNEWTEIKTKNNLKWFHDKQICNSTNPIEVDGFLLMFFHTKEQGIYYHGALLMDKKGNVKHQTKKPIMVTGRNDGMQKGLHYISGSCLIGNTVRVYVGENDSHAYTIDFNKKDLIKAIK